MGQIDRLRADLSDIAIKHVNEQAAQADVRKRIEAVRMFAKLPEAVSLANGIPGAFRERTHESLVERQVKSQKAKGKGQK